MLCLEAWPILTRYMRVSFCEWIHKWAQTDVCWRVTRPLRKPKKRDGVPDHITSHGIQVCDSFILAHIYIYIYICVCVCVCVCVCPRVCRCVRQAVEFAMASQFLAVICWLNIWHLPSQETNYFYMLWKLKPL